MWVKGSQAFSDGVVVSDSKSLIRQAKYARDKAIQHLLTCRKARRKQEAKEAYSSLLEQVELLRTLEGE